MARRFLCLFIGVASDDRHSTSATTGLSCKNTIIPEDRHCLSKRHVQGAEDMTPHALTEKLNIPFQYYYRQIKNTKIRAQYLYMLPEQSFPTLKKPSRTPILPNVLTTRS